ncbi:MAG: ribbon-helix-helix protein, CopG family [Dehalococcoidia bacterium]|nr:ribbon-helix-helix protein, CopG family [Dehalococcoidia bacterium]
MSREGQPHGRAGGAEYAARINAAVALLAAGSPVVDAARALAGRFGLSERQARRYVERAAAGGPVEAPQTTTVFTVKLPVPLVGRVREHAAASGRTISAVVAQALEEFLPRGQRERPRR